MFFKIPKGKSEAVNRERKEQYNDRKKKNKRTNNNLQNNTQKTKDWTPYRFGYCMPHSTVF